MGDRHMAVLGSGGEGAEVRWRECVGGRGAEVKLGKGGKGEMRKGRLQGVRLRVAE